MFGRSFMNSTLLEPTEGLTRKSPNGVDHRAENGIG